MKKCSFVFALTLLTLPPLIAQVSNPSIIVVSSAPSGSCGGSGLPMQYVFSTGVLYACQNGTWGQIGGGGGGGPYVHLAGDTMTGPLVLTTPRQPAYAAINMWGDSLTSGNQDGSGITVCTALSTLSGLTCNNKGMGGYTSTQILAQMTASPPAAGTLNVIWAGTNDPGNATTVLSNIQSMVALVNAQSAYYLILPPLSIDNVLYWGPSASNYQSILNIRQGEATAYPSSFIDIREQLVGLFNVTLSGDRASYTHDTTPYSQRATYTGATLTGTINASTCAIALTTPPGNFASWMTLQIDSEQIYVTTEATGTVSACQRGINGTTAASHTAGASITVWDYVHLGGATGYTYVANQIYQWMLSNPSTASKYAAPVQMVNSSALNQQSFAGSNGNATLPYRQLSFGTPTRVIFGPLAGSASGAIPSTASTYAGITAMGYQALNSFLGNYETAVGFQAGLVETDAAYNTYLGAFAGNANVHSNSNTGVGRQALYVNIAGNNTAIGSQSLGGNTSGADNTAVGNTAGYTATAANANVSGSQNTWIGSMSGPGSTTQYSNATAIGYAAHSTSSNQVVLGNSSVTQTVLNGTMIMTAAAPTVSAGSVATYSTNAGGAITSLSAATTVTLTFANSGWANAAFCVANASTSTALPYVSAISNTAVTFTFTSLTGTLYYHCDGN